MSEDNSILKSVVRVKQIRVYIPSEDLIERLISSSDKVRRGRVWCLQCGETMLVQPRTCFREGWPTCCGETMSLDTPEERLDLDKAYLYEMAHWGITHFGKEIMDHLELKRIDIERIGKLLHVVLDEETISDE